MANLRSWSQMYPSSTPRATVPRTRTVPPPRNQYGLSYSPSGRQVTEQVPYYSVQEIVENIRRMLQKRPTQFRRTGGQVQATKSMLAPELPQELAGKTALHNLFSMPGEAPRTLDVNWMLPGEALDKPKMMTSSVPPTDIQRQSAYLQGMEGTGQTISRLNPSRHWPESSFKIPTQVRKGVGGAPLSVPVTGATIDYTTGEWTAPPQPYGYAQTYGRFGGRTTPQMGGVRTTPQSWRKYGRSRLESRRQVRKAQPKKRRRIMPNLFY